MFGLWIGCTACCGGDEERGSVVFGAVVVFVAFGYSSFFGELFSPEMERVFSSLK